jgi:hypothetical protein
MCGLPTPDQGRDGRPKASTSPWVESGPMSPGALRLGVETSLTRGPSPPSSVSTLRCSAVPSRALATMVSSVGWSRSRRVGSPAEGESAWAPAMTSRPTPGATMAWCEDAASKKNCGDPGGPPRSARVHTGSGHFASPSGRQRIHPPCPPDIEDHASTTHTTLTFPPALHLPPVPLSRSSHSSFQAIHQKRKRRE